MVTIRHRPGSAKDEPRQHEESTDRNGKAERPGQGDPSLRVSPEQSRTCQGIGRIFLAAIDGIASEEGGDEWLPSAMGPVQELSHGDHLVQCEWNHDQHGKSGDQRRCAPCADYDGLNDDEVDAHDP